MGLLDQLWDDTLAGPRPESGLGMLRKNSAFSFQSKSGKGMHFAGGAFRQILYKIFVKLNRKQKLNHNHWLIYDRTADIFHINVQIIGTERILHLVSSIHYFVMSKQESFNFFFLNCFWCFDKRLWLESNVGNVRSNVDEPPLEATKVTRSIMIVKPPGYQNGSPPVSPAGSTPPVSPFSGKPDILVEMIYCF